MKKILVLVPFLFSLLNNSMIAQFKIDPTNLKKAKQIASVIATPKDSLKDIKAPVNVSGNKATNTSSPLSVISSTSSSLQQARDLQGWKMEEVSNSATINRYFVAGWVLDNIEPTKNYNSSLPVPCIKVTYKGVCYPQPLIVRVFKMQDKGAVVKYDFAKEAQNAGAKGEYKSELVIADHDKYIVIFSLMEGVDEDTDKFIAEYFPEVRTRVPFDWACK